MLWLGRLASVSDQQMRTRLDLASPPGFDRGSARSSQSNIGVRQPCYKYCTKSLTHKNELAETRKIMRSASIYDDNFRFLCLLAVERSSRRCSEQGHAAKTSRSIVTRTTMHLSVSLPSPRA